MIWNVGKKIGIGYVVSLLLFVVLGWITYTNTSNLIATSTWVEHTHKVLKNLEVVLSNLKDTETGQRGYIITGEERYLEPFKTGIRNVHDVVSQLRTLTEDNPKQQARLRLLDPPD